MFVSVAFFCISARALLLPAKPASALDETLPLVQALVAIALELHATSPSDASTAIAGSVEAELERKKEAQRLTSLYKLFPAMLDVVAVEGFRPDRCSDISVLVELAIQRFTSDMDHAVHLLTQPSLTPSNSTPTSPSSSAAANSTQPQSQQSVSSAPCNPQGFHTEAWQFLTMLSRLLLFESMDVIGPAALSHLPTALILFIGKLQAKLAERRQGIAHSSSDSLPFSPPLLTALDIPTIKLHPYTTAPTTFEQLHSQVFGMLYIMCKHEDPLFDVMFGGHLRTLFSVFTNGAVCEKAFHDEAPDDNAAVVWSAGTAKHSSSLHFVSSASFRAGVMMVMNGIMQHHPQDGLEYIQAHDILTQLLGTISAPYPSPMPSASQEPDPRPGDGRRLRATDDAHTAHCSQARSHYHVLSASALAESQQCFAASRTDTVLHILRLSPSLIWCFVLVRHCPSAAAVRCLIVPFFVRRSPLHPILVIDHLCLCCPSTAYVRLVQLRSQFAVSPA